MLIKLLTRERLQQPRDRQRTEFSSVLDAAQLQVQAATPRLQILARLTATPTASTTKTITQ